MPWMPIHRDELDAAEQQLGVTLPAAYKARLSDPRIVAMLSHPAVGAMWPGLTMQSFVDATLQFRRATPGFPPDGVLATLPEGRYLRFWRADPKDPRTLGEMVYSWDTQRHRPSRDCTSERWVQSMIEVLHQADAGFLQQIGYPAPVVAPPPPLFSTRPCDAALMALLSLRADAAAAAVTPHSGQWLPCARLAVRGRYLAPCDLGGLPQSSDWALKVEPGFFQATVRVQMSARGDRPVIAALRLLREGTVGTVDVEGDVAAHVDVDTAALAIYDRQPFQRRVRIDERDVFADELQAVPERPCIVAAGRSLEILVVPSGEGDGRYPVRVCRDEHDAVGLQIDFIPPQPDLTR